VSIDVRLSSDGRTVTSRRLRADNIEMLEVWDSGKGTICRVSMNAGEHIVTYVQARLIDKNCMFVCVKRDS